MKQQTAVQWLEECINIGLTYEQEVMFEGLFEQAKAMEKEQIMDAYNFGIKDEYVIGSQQYYKETYEAKETN